MAKRRESSRGAGGRTRAAQGSGVPTALHEAIEAERDNLSRAESLLDCLTRSMACDCEAESDARPYYPDIARMASQMVRASINGLDSLTLDRALQRNKVKDAYRLEIASRYH